MKTSLHSPVLLALTLMGGAIALPPMVHAQAPAAAAAEYSIKENYTKYEYRIPMRDGVKLFTAVYVPKDASKPYPMLLERTPYSAAPYGVDFTPRRLGPSADFPKAGYIFVVQDVRGRFMSEGKFIEMTPHKPNKGAKDFDESTDMFDTVEWLLKNVPNHNGKVGIWGNSYPGFFVSASIIDSHPAIKAASPQAPVTDLYMNDDSYHNGAFMLAANFGFYANFKPQNNPTVEPRKSEPYDFGTQDGYEFYLKHRTIPQLIEKAGKDSLFRDQVVNDTYNAYWKTRNISAHLKNVKPAVLTVGGWFDAEDPQGPLTTYREIGRHNPGTVNMLVMGPWAHGNWISRDGEKLGHVSFGFKTAEHYRKNILLPFFEKYLKDKADTKGNDGAGAKPVNVHAFETGTNVWRQYPAWPPAEAKARTLHFHAGGKLSWAAPAGSAAFDEYVSDPDKPVPYINAIGTGMYASYMTGDQRFAATRTDVLTYQTEVLEEDVTIAGPIVAKLFVSSTGTDSDFVVKLVDVYPPEMPEAEASSARPTDVQPPPFKMSGYQQLVRGEPMRAKFRNSFEKPEPLTPGKVERVHFNMPDVHHTFRRGHRIMVQVQSSWFPLTDLNPQKFVRIPEAKPEDFQKATQRVYRGGASASGVEVRVLGK
ncbi:MAG: CocE/NonD family hydrolase [Betaproteobacteria bacterium]|nr:CocE/NonD family hydrolase [Betaproteobacteria bacterium]